MNGKFIAPERRLAQGACKNTNYNRHQQPHRTTYNNMKQHGWITVSFTEVFLSYKYYLQICGHTILLPAPRRLCDNQHLPFFLVCLFVNKMTLKAMNEFK